MRTVCLCVIAANLYGGIALSSAAPAPTTAPKGAARIDQKGSAPAMLSHRMLTLLKSTAARLGKTARASAPHGAASTGAPKVEAPLPAPGPRPTAPRVVKPNVTLSSPVPRVVQPNVTLSSPLPYVPQEAFQWVERYIHLTKQGDDFAKGGQWDAATETYSEALRMSPTYPAALYGIAACAGAAGDVRDEILFYRHAVYSSSSSANDGYGFRENDFAPLMKFVLILSQVGQNEEALAVYRRAVVLLDYEDGKPSIPVLLPQLGQGGAAYTPQRLQAMAQLALGIESSDRSESRARLTEALRLWPESAAANYYLGISYDETNEDNVARPYMERARQFGDAAARAEAGRMLRFFSPAR